MTLLEEDHWSAIEENSDFKKNAAKECAKITLQFTIDVIQDMRWNWIGVNGDAYNDAGYKIKELKKQLSDLNK